MLWPWLLLGLWVPVRAAYFFVEAGTAEGLCGK